MQLITVPDSNLHSYYKKGKVGDDANAVERLEEWENVDNAIKEFVRLFEELTGNEFEPWEREMKFEKKRLCFYPIDMVKKCFCYNSQWINFLLCLFLYIYIWMVDRLGILFWIG